MTPIARRFLVPALAALAAGGLLAGCGSEGSSDSSGSTTTAAANASGSDDGNVVDDGGATPEAPSVPETPADAEGCRTEADAQAETEEPDPAVPAEDETSLVATDDIPGCGDLVAADSTVSVQYTLKSKSSGEVVDSSWGRGEPFELTLGQGSVISGWELGIPGMRAGGRRTLLLGPEYAYGPAGSPPDIAENDTLVFVVDVLSVS